MKLSMNIIAEELGQSFPLMNFRICNTANSLERIMFLSDTTLPAENTLYLADNSCNSVLSLIPEGSGVLFLEEPCRTDFSCDYIVLETDASSCQVANYIQELFTAVNTWETEAYYALLASQGFQQLFDSARKFLQNPVYLHDKDYHILAYSEDSSNPTMKKSYDFIRSGKISPKAILNLSRNPEFIRTFDSDQSAYCKKSSLWPDEYNYIYHNIKINGTFAGRIFVDERIRPFKSLDYAILDRLSELVEKTLSSRPFSSGCSKNKLEKLAEELLNGHIPNADTVSHILHDSEWDQYHEFFCFSIRLQEKSMKYSPADSLCLSIQAVFSNCCLFQYNQDITGIIPIKEKDTRRSSFTRCLTPILTNYRLQAGISSVFHDFTDLAFYYQQAHALPELVSPAQDSSPVVIFDDHIMSYILKQLLGSTDPLSLLPNGLKLLIQHDRDNLTNYVQTLRTYLECCCSPTQATKQLFIHRSTFLYRLDKISEIANIDFNDSEQRLLYLISFKILDLLPKDPAPIAAVQ